LAMTAGTLAAVAAGRLWLGLDGRAAVTVTFLTLAFAQLWQVFNMRHPRSPLLRNEVTRNPWLWAALLLCTALLAVPPYVAPMAQVMHLAPPTATMWAVVLGLSLVPMLVVQAVLLVRHRRERASGP